MKSLQLIGRSFVWTAVALMLLVPIYVNSDFFFPFIFSKALVIRIVVEIGLAVLLLNAAWLIKDKIKIDVVTIIFAVYLSVMYVSSLLGGDFYLSFWSYIERSEGLLLWTHLFLLYVIIRNTVTSEKMWMIIFDIFFAAAQVVALVGLAQYLNWDFINSPGMGEERVASTIGNAAFLAGYLLFAFWIGMFMILKRSKRWYVYYIAGMLVDIFVMFQTGTRGAVLGLLVGIAIAGVYTVGRSSVKTIRRTGLIALTIIIGFVGLVFAFKDSSVVQSNLGLRRLASISATDTTAQARFQTWGSAWQGFQERPLLGYGQENFYLVFNKYFNPLIYRHANSRVWYDRAHNIFIDHLITGGIVGFILYSLLLAIPLWWLVRYQIQERQKRGGIDKELLREQMILMALVGFIVQGLFVFESLPVYIGLLLLLAYVSWRYGQKTWHIPTVITRIASIAVIIALIPAMYFFNIREAQANLASIEGITAQSTDPAAAVDAYDRAIEYQSSGTQEYRRRLAEYVAGLVANRSLSPAQLIPFVRKVDTELQQRVQQSPRDVSNYLLYMRFLNTTYVLDPNRLLLVQALADKALNNSPTRPQLYYELGYTNFYLYKWYLQEGKIVEAADVYKKMKINFQKSIDLNPGVKESYVNLVMVLLASNNSTEADEYLHRMDDLKITYTDNDTINRVVNAAIEQKNYLWLKDFYLLLKARYPEDPNYYIGAALSYANLRDFSNAIKYATEAKHFGGNVAKQSEIFISCVNNKTYTFEPSFACKP